MNEGLILTLVTARYTRRLRSLIIEKIARLPISYFDQHQFGDTLSRMSNDIGIIANTLATVLTQIITSITMVVGILIMMLTISVSLSVVALIVVPVSLLLVSRFAKLAQKRSAPSITPLKKITPVNPSSKPTRTKTWPLRILPAATNASTKAPGKPSSIPPSLSRLSTSAPT